MNKSSDRCTAAAATYSAPPVSVESALLLQVDESIAEPLSWVIEELQTAFASESTDSDSALDRPISGRTS